MIYAFRLLRRGALLGVLSAGVLGLGLAPAAWAGGGNSANAKRCQKGGWMNLVRSNGTTFANQDACVSYGAKGGTLEPKPTCTAGSENFSEDADESDPTTFSGGTIDGPYGSEGDVRVQGDDWNGGFAAGAHLLFSGEGVSSFQLTFTHAVGSVTLDAQPGTFNSVTDTLTAYDASNTAVGSDSASDSGRSSVNTLTVTSATNNINHFTIATDDPGQGGIAFSNITWSCN